jgi:hypothetical protein
MLTSLRTKPYYRLILGAAILLNVTLLVILTMRGVTSPSWIFADDYVEYWAAGRLNISGGNPYDPGQLLPLQLQAGRYFMVPVMMWNPPGMLALVMPFGLLPYALSRTLWLLIFFLIVLKCVSVVWQLYHGPPQLLWVSWLVGFAFIPVLEAFKTGQTGPLLFLGIVGFLYSLRRGSYWIAGAFLALLVVKPHILYLYGLAVLVWSIERRQVKVVLGAIFALGITTGIALAANPEVIDQYLYAIANYPPEDWGTPTVGGVLRMIFGIDRFWMQFIAPVFGIAWFVYFWTRHRRTWDWVDRSPLLILVSVATAPYGWTSDQTVSLVPILQITALLFATAWQKSNLKIIFWFVLFDLILAVFRVNNFFFFWLAPSLLIWYLGSMKILKERSFLSQPALSETDLVA